MIELFVLVISMWGYDGNNWKYIGNQIVLNQPMSIEVCTAIRENWTWHELNEYYRFSIECHKK